MTGSTSWGSRSGMAGVGLIEVLISMLVLGVGILGVAAMQATALRNSQSALDRSQATINIYNILEAMRANPQTARSGGYNISKTCAAPAALSLITQDLANWLNGLRTTMGSSACGQINCVLGSSFTTCTITVSWDDSRGKQGSEAQEFSVMTQL